MSATESMAAITKKSKAKAAYYLKDGTKVQGATTILNNVLSKGEGLIRWHNQQGLKGIDTRKHVDALATIGTLAHAMILADLRGTDPAAEGAGYDAATVDLAENCLISYYAWKKPLMIDPILVETPLVSEGHGFGGTPDFYGNINGIFTVLDFKTGKGIWPEHWYQLAAYASLIRERVSVTAWPEKYIVLNIPRAETESFDAKVRTDLSIEWQIFTHALAIYNLKKAIEK